MNSKAAVARGFMALYTLAKWGAWLFGVLALIVLAFTVFGGGAYDGTERVASLLIALVWHGTTLVLVKREMQIRHDELETSLGEMTLGLGWALILSFAIAFYYFGWGFLSGWSWTLLAFAVALTWGPYYMLRWARHFDSLNR